MAVSENGHGLKMANDMKEKLMEMMVGLGYDVDTRVSQKATSRVAVATIIEPFTHWTDVAGIGWDRYGCRLAKTPINTPVMPTRVELISHSNPY